MATGRVPTTANSPLTAKGDLFGYSTTQARVAVGNDGETLVADSSASTGLRWQGNFAAGKNKIINGDFNIWQRGTTFNSISNGAYCADRYLVIVAGSGASMNITRQAFSAGNSLPNTTFFDTEPNFFAQAVTTAGSDAGSLLVLSQRIEDRRTFAGKTVTVSFWAKATSGTPKIGLNMEQGNTGRIGAQSVTVSTSWARYSATFTVPASTTTSSTDNWVSVELFLSAGSTYNSISGSIGLQSNTFQIWGLQAEVGNVATAFETATGTLAGELAACQRYYFRFVPGNNGYIYGTSYNYASTNGVIAVKFPVSMRTRPTAVEQSGTASDYAIWRANTVAENLTSVPTYDGATTSEMGILAGAVAGNLTANTMTYFAAKTTTSYLGWSAEL